MSTLVAQTISNGTVSTSSANVIQGSAKAWVTFAGNNSGAIAASYNVSSVTANGSQVFTINFTNAFSDTNYCFVTGLVSDNNTAYMGLQGYQGGTRTTTAFQVNCRVGTGGTAGATPLYAAFFR